MPRRAIRRTGRRSRQMPHCECGRQRCGPKAEVQNGCVQTSRSSLPSRGGVRASRSESAWAHRPLNEVVLDITAVPGAGNLLGNLLCAVANLLNGGSPLSTLLTQLQTLLNQILAAL